MRDVTVYLASDLHPGEHVVLQPDFDSCEFDLNAAKSQLAALREELAAHLKIRDRELDIAAEHADDLQQRLADAERLLKRAVLSIDRLSFTPEKYNSARWEDLHAIVADISAALNHNPEAASHDE